MNEPDVVVRWRVRGTCGEVADILGDPLALPHWWPAACLSADELAPGGQRGVGRRVALRTRGYLPWTVSLSVEVVESRYPRGLTIAVSGDIVGSGTLRLTQDGEYVDVVHDWDAQAHTAVLRALSSSLGPLCESNLRWALAQGETSLQLELSRRRAISDAARLAVAPPPGPVTYAAVALVGGAGIVTAALWWLIRRPSRPRR